jgi:hypothetical protein
MIAFQSMFRYDSGNRGMTAFRRHSPSISKSGLLRSRWLIAILLALPFLSIAAHASKHRDLPTNGGGTIDSCDSGSFQTLYVSYDPNASQPEFEPVVELTPVTVQDSSGNSYTVHVDVYDLGTLAGCPYSYPNLPPESELRTSGTYSMFFVYVLEADGVTFAPVNLKSLQISLPLANPLFFNCQGDSGWEFCNTPVDGLEGSSQDYGNGPIAYSLQPAPSPGADGSGTVWNFGIPYDFGNGYTTGGPVPLNSNASGRSFPVDINNAPFYYTAGQGTAVLVADGTVECDNPIDGICNNIRAATPYRLAFYPPNSTTPLTASSNGFSTPAAVSAAGHDSSDNPIILRTGDSSATYDVSANGPSLINGNPSTVSTFVCESISASPIQEYRSVWFSYTPTVSTTVEFSTAGSHYDTVLSEVTLPEVSQTPGPCNDDTDPPTSSEPNGMGLVTSDLVVPVTVGNTYLLQVTEYPPSPLPLGVETYDPTTQTYNQDLYVSPLSGDPTLTFTVTAPRVLANPPRLLNFPAVMLGAAPVSKSVVLTSDTAKFGSTGITGITVSASGDFTVTPTSCASPLPDSGPGCQLTVTFSPTGPGVRNGTLLISTSGTLAAANTPLSVPLSGLGIGTPTVTWKTPANISYGTPLGAQQLDATASIPGKFTYSPSLGTVLPLGLNTLEVTFTPQDSRDFVSVTASVPIDVVRAQTSIRWVPPASIVYGTKLSSTQLDATTSAVGTLSYSPSAGTLLTAGQHTLTVTFTPTNAADYSAATASVSIMVYKQTPKLTWATPVAITYGTALGAAQLNATTSVAGTFTYSPALGTQLQAGSTTLTAKFTPSDSADYYSDSVTVVLDVLRALPKIAWSKPASITYGTPLTSKQLDASVGASGPTGSFAYSPAANTVLGAGQHTLQTTFTPTNVTDYTTATAMVPLSVLRAIPTLTWANPAPIKQGTPLSNTQLDAVASVPGKFNYSKPIGTVLARGTYTLTVSFVPTDATDYYGATAKVTLTVE